MITEWQAAKEEFKDNAFKRFVLAKSWGNRTERGFNSNDDLELYIKSGDLVALKALPELFAHDVEVYGENAYLMWECVVKSSHAHIKLKRNRQVQFCLNDCTKSYIIRRKTSAALPFDLSRAIYA